MIGRIGRQLIQRIGQGYPRLAVAQANRCGRVAVACVPAPFKPRRGRKTVGIDRAMRGNATGGQRTQRQRMRHR